MTLDRAQSFRRYPCICFLITSSPLCLSFSFVSNHHSTASSHLSAPLLSFALSLSCSLFFNLRVIISGALFYKFPYLCAFVFRIISSPSTDSPTSWVFFTGYFSNTCHMPRRVGRFLRACNFLIIFLSHLLRFYSRLTVRHSVCPVSYTHLEFCSSGSVQVTYV